MRFVFPPDDVDSARERMELRHTMDGLWHQIARLFETRCADERAITRLAQQLDPDISSELLVERDGSHTLVVTPREERRKRPLIDAFVGCAPKLNGARVTTHRPARSLEEAIATVKDELGFELGSSRARVGFSRGHLLELVIYGKGFGGRDDHDAACAAERLVECLVGERLLDDWVGQISAEPLAQTGKLRVIRADETPTLPLAELPQTVASATESLRSGLPELPRAPLRDGWTMFEAKPESQPDYAAQDDIVLTASALPEMLKCFLEGAPFSSLRFTRRDEVFAYLKLDGGDKSFEERLADRLLLEDRLSAELEAMGTLVGNGLGMRYAYIDIALTPNAEAIETVCRVAREAGAPRRSWILFCDTDWADEWVGVWPETPAPAA
jgi:hypothetical protein